METNVEIEKKPKKSRSKKFAPEAEAAVNTEQVEGEASEAKVATPRPRKYNYGIIPEARCVRLSEAPKVAKNIAEAWTATDDEPTVEEFFNRVEVEPRHCLRVLLRSGHLKLVHPDGTEYPQEYVAPVKVEATEEVAEAAE